MVAYLYFLRDVYEEIGKDFFWKKCHIFVKTGYWRNEFNKIKIMLKIIGDYTFKK